MRTLISSFFLALLFSCTTGNDHVTTSENHLLLSSTGAESIMKQQSHEVISTALDKLNSKVSSALLAPIDVPLPTDPGGGYTHEKHKANYSAIKDVGTLYLLTKNSEYFDFTRAMLIEYAKLYPTLGLHPQQKNQGPGKLFWKILNEEVALVHFIQGFDAIKYDLNTEDSTFIVDGLLLPMVEFIRDDSERTFRKIHNHAMWGAAAVGMTAMVLNDEELLLDALYGPDNDSLCGYFAMVDQLFSPDGYYSEGPYYQRYALMPLVLLAQALEINRPELNVFEFKDGVILKSIETGFELSDCRGYFFPVNDAVKSKSIETPELGYALPIIYAYGGKQSKWIDAIAINGNCMITDALVNIGSRTEQFARASRFISDGADGSVGGMAILRSSESCDGLTSVLKFGTHGMGHGHFDQLGLQVFAEGTPFITDYGASRFHNVPQKEGGRYLPENNTWANQTIAHNTITIGKKSQHNGNDGAADRSVSHLLHKSFSDTMSVIVALDSSAYSGSQLLRYHVMLTLNKRPYLLDIQSVKNRESLPIDAPFFYEKSLVNSDPVLKYETTSLTPLGTDAGYQHLWKTGYSEQTKSSLHTWQMGSGFITMYNAAIQPYSTVAVKTGANDPNHNLISTEGLILETMESRHQAICTIFEQHGSYDPVFETTQGAYGSIENLEINALDSGYKVTLSTNTNEKYEIVLNGDIEAMHESIIKIKQLKDE